MNIANRRRSLETGPALGEYPGKGLRRSFMEFFLCVIGMVMFIEGLPYFAFPDKMKRLIASLLALPEGTLRRFGFMLMLSGLFLVYLGKN